MLVLYFSKSFSKFRTTWPIIQTNEIVICQHKMTAPYFYPFWAISRYTYVVMFEMIDFHIQLLFTFPRMCNRSLYPLTREICCLCSRKVYSKSVLIFRSQHLSCFSILVSRYTLQFDVLIIKLNSQIIQLSLNIQCNVTNVAICTEQGLRF